MSGMVFAAMMKRLAAAAGAGVCLCAVAAAQVQLETASLELDTGAILDYEEGRIAVPEARGKPDSRRISIGFRRVAKSADASGAPVFLLAGGPGGSFNERLDEGGERQADSVRLINMYRRVGDVVMVDLRGVNLSTPNTLCNGAPNKWRRIATRAAFLDVIEDTGRACREKLLKEGFDLTGYTVLEAAQDVLAVADALGYEKINAAGGSFGSHWGIVLAKYHGERIDRLFLNGIEGLDHTYDDSGAVAQSVSTISRMAETVWGGAFGYAGPLEALTALHGMAGEAPRKAFGLRPFEIENFALYGRSYWLGDREGMPDWPRAVADMMDGKVFYHKLARWVMARRMGLGWDAAAVGMFDCASGISEARRAVLMRRPLGAAGSDLEYYDALCRGWDVPMLPPEFREDFRSDAPTLFINGDIDVSTPLANARQTIELFENGELIVVEGGSHNVLIEVLEADEDAAAQIVEWFYSGQRPSFEPLPPLEFTPLK